MTNRIHSWIVSLVSLENSYYAPVTKMLLCHNNTHTHTGTIALSRLSSTTRVSQYQKKHSSTHTHVEEGFTQTTNSAFSQWQRLLEGWQSWSQYLLLCRTHCIGVHPLATASITARHLLDFMVQGKITEADAPTIRLDDTPSRLSVPPPPSSPIFYAECPFCHIPPNVSWLGTGSE